MSSFDKLYETTISKRKVIGFWVMIIICENNHEQILYSQNTYSYCPLCSLTKHNNDVHDFIESIPNLVPKLVSFQLHRQKQEENMEAEISASNNKKSVPCSEKCNKYFPVHCNSDSGFRELCFK